MDETFYDANVCEICIRTRFAQEYVRVVRRVSMDEELCMVHLSPNDLDQLCGLLRRQALNSIADFNEPHRVHFDPLKSLLNPTGNGSEFPRGMFSSRLRSLKTNV